MVIGEMTGSFDLCQRLHKIRPLHRRFDVRAAGGPRGERVAVDGADLLLELPQGELGALLGHRVGLVGGWWCGCVLPALLLVDRSGGGPVGLGVGVKWGRMMMSLVIDWGCASIDSHAADSPMRLDCKAHKRGRDQDACPSKNGAVAS